MSVIEEKEFRSRIERLEALIQDIEGLPDPTARAHAQELVQALLDFHGAALARLLDQVAAAGAPGRALMDSLARDDLVSSLLLLYGLHPLDIEARVQHALEGVRPYLRSHGGDVELLGVSEGVVRLRMQGSCHGCPSSAMTLKLAIEEAIYASAPDAAGLEVEGVVESLAPGPPQIVPLGPLPGGNGRGRPGRVGWEDVEGLASLPEGAMRRVEVAGRPVLVGRVAGTLYAYGPSCPGCGRGLDGGVLAGLELVCDGCGRRFDVSHAGRGLEEPFLHLDPFPLLVEDGRVMIAVPA